MPFVERGGGPNPKLPFVENSADNAFMGAIRGSE